MYLEDRIRQLFDEQGNCLVSFVGGGGKTTSIYALADLLDLPVVVTTTTAMFKPDGQSVSKIFYEPEEPMCFGNETVAYFSGVHPDHENKVKGVSLDSLNRLMEKGTRTVVLNEADGANRKPLKAYAAHEPMIPEKTDLVVIVVGLDVIGKPANDQWVHRLDRFLEISGAAMGEAVTWTHIMRLLTHDNGFSKAIPRESETILLLNKFDALSEHEGLQAFLESKPSWINEVIVANMKDVKEIDGFQ